LDRSIGLQIVNLFDHLFSRQKHQKSSHSLIMNKFKPDKYDAEDLSRQTTTAEGQLEKKFSKLTMTGMAFAILK